MMLGQLNIYKKKNEVGSYLLPYTYKKLVWNVSQTEM